MTPCNIWRNATNRGYPIKNISGKTYYITRLKLAEKFKLDYNDKTWVAMHICDQPSCINIEHLKVGTSSDNARDAVEKKRHNESRKTHCIYGHEFSPNNTKVTTLGKRVCLICRRAFDKKRNQTRVSINGKRIRL